MVERGERGEKEMKTSGVGNANLGNTLEEYMLLNRKINQNLLNGQKSNKEGAKRWKEIAFECLKIQM